MAVSFNFKFFGLGGHPSPSPIAQAGSVIVTVTAADSDSGQDTESESESGWLCTSPSLQPPGESQRPSHPSGVCFCPTPRESESQAAAPAGRALSLRLPSHGVPGPTGSLFSAA